MTDSRNWAVMAKATEARNYAKSRKDVFARFVGLNGALGQARNAIREGNITAARRHVSQAIRDTEGVRFPGDYRELLDVHVFTLEASVRGPAPAGVTQRRWTNLQALVERLVQMWDADPIDWDAALRLLDGQESD